MRRPMRVVPLACAAFVALAVFAVPPLLSQEAEPPAPAEDAVESIEEILAQEEAMLSGEGYFYDPGDRRDPFRSLLAARTQVWMYRRSPSSRCCARTKDLTPVRSGLGSELSWPDAAGVMDDASFPSEWGKKPRV